MATKRRGLGRGLDALLGPEISVQTQEPRLRDIPIEWIKPGKYQPRKGFNEEGLHELAASIKVQGVLQPIVLRQLGAEQFEIIAGERRWRATQLAGLEKIPATVRKVDDEAAIAMSLIENIQREDLNPWEESLALQRLIEEFDLTHQQVADAVGKSRTSVTNILRLKNLQSGVVRLLLTGDIEMGHARALLALDDIRQEQAAREISARQLNVRQAEALVRKILADDSGSRGKQTRKIDGDTRALQERLSLKLGQSVSIQHTAKGKGKLSISYSSLDELDGILAQFGDLE